MNREKAIRERFKVFEKLKLKSSSNYRKLNDILTVLSGK